MAVRSTGFVQTILGPSAGSIAESAASTIGHITLDVKQTGEPGAGKPPARIDVAGIGNGSLDTAPVLDPTLGGARREAGTYPTIVCDLSS